MKNNRRLLALLSLLTLLALLMVRPAAAQTGNAPVIAGDELWSSFPVGLNGTVYAVAVNGDDVYLGGQFSLAGTTPVNNIVRWNQLTHQFYPLGQGVSSQVNSLAIFGTHLYASGAFVSAGGQFAARLAQWNMVTQTWSPVGDGTLSHSGAASAWVNAVAVDASGNLYIAGEFESVSGVAALNVARWNGSAWSALGSGLGTPTEHASSLLVNGTDLYAGGNFTTPANGIAHWNGSTWSGLAFGTKNSTNPDVLAITLFGSNLIIGGRFDIVRDSNGNHPVHDVAMWNGTNWSGMGDGFDSTVQALVHDSSGNIYAGGWFGKDGASSTVFDTLARWNGSAWSPISMGVQIGTNGSIMGLFVNGSTLYAVGNATIAAGMTIGRAGYYDTISGTWYSLGSGVNGAVNALAVSSSTVYLGGAFTSVAGRAWPAVGVWKASSNTWPSLGTAGLAGCSGFFCQPTVNAVLVTDTDLIVTGNFTTAGGVAANKIARWNFSDKQWHAMGSGLTCSVPLCVASGSALTTNPASGVVYVGGSFTSAGGVAANNLAQWTPWGGWNNATWGISGNDVLETNGPIYALAWNQDSLYAGGNFTTPTTRIFACDMLFSIFSIGSTKLNGAVKAIAIDNDNLYVGGDFTNANGTSATSYLVKRSTLAGNWLAVGAGPDGPVHALALYGGRLVAGGAFTQVGAQGLAHIGLWNGSSWSNLGSGTDGDVNALFMDGDFIYAGGSFNHAGGLAAVGFSRWGQYHRYLPGIKR